MEKRNLHILTTCCSILFVTVFFYGCTKSTVTPPPVKVVDKDTKPKILYTLDDTLYSTTTQMWTVDTDGSNNKKMTINIPAGLHFEFNSDIAAEVSPDSKTMVLSLENSNESTFFYKCNIDGTGPQLIPNASGYLQTFINTTTILYWQNADNNHNGELWKVNTDGTGNQKINITLPDNIYFGDGKFAKVTADGKTIVFSTTYAFNNNGGLEIYKCNIDGSGLTQVISYDNYFGTLQALVNSTTILESMATNFMDAGAIWQLNIDGSNPHIVFIPTAVSAGSIFGDSRLETVNNSLFCVVQDLQNAQAIYSANVNNDNTNSAAIKLITKIPAGYAVKLQGVIH